jgi:hypothetical protein
MSVRRSSALRLTRRQMAAALGASPLLAQVTSKTPPQATPTPPQPPATPQERLQKAYADVRNTSNQLAQIEVPIFLEPAFVFHA